MKSNRKHRYSVLSLLAILSLLLSSTSTVAVAAPVAMPSAAPVAAPPNPSAAPTSVTIAGNLQNELGCPGDWQPECATTHLADKGNGVWRGEFNVPAGSYEYKAALNDSWAESYAGNHQTGGGNTTLNQPANGPVRFYFDDKTKAVLDSVMDKVAVATGSFQSEVGCTGDWQPDCVRSLLTDTDGDGVYSFAATNLAPGSYEFKVAFNEAWGGDLPANNVPFAIASPAEQVRITWNSTNNDVNVSVGEPGPTSVTLVGDLQSELGCIDNGNPADWQVNCAATHLAKVGNGVWRGEFAIPQGNWLYKAALDDSWAESYAGNHKNNDGNTTLNQPVAGTVRFYFDYKTKAVLDSVMDKVAVATGSFQSEVGCTGVNNGDWQPGCVRSLLTDVDGDGLYTFVTNLLPAASYEFKIAFNESWGGDVPANNVPFTVGENYEKVTISWNSATNLVDVMVGEQLDPELVALVQPPVRHPVADQVFYFVMPDRFDNGDPSNDLGGLAGDRSVNGFDPTDKGYYHGGDVKGLQDQLDYLEEMGIDAIWMTPMFKNKPVQGTGNDASAAYHGYWTVDYTQFDPHFGTNAELTALIADAHSRDMKVFFDIVTNHTADIIQYEENQYSYRNKIDYPFRDDQGTPFDDRDYIDDPNFPSLDPDVSFAYQPTVAPAEANAKTPAWLNDPIYYHNRGNSSFSGENSLYGDFFGLDDLFTEHPAVVDGMTDIFKDWITNFEIDGFRVDTVKHVNAEFWQRFAPEILDHATAQGRPDFFLFGEVYSGNEQLLSFYTTNASLPSVLDFGFQDAARGYASRGGSSDALRDFFAKDDWFTDADSNAYSLMNFIGNHDMGRIGYFLKADNAGSMPANALERTKLAHAMMYFARGVPIVYYGDEQGFVGDGGDKDARQDMMPSQVASYNDDDLIGTDSTTADDNFDLTHPMFMALKDFAAIYDAYPTLRSGAQIHRYSTGSAGIYALSRYDRDERVEYVVAFNNAATEQSATFDVFEASTTYSAVWPSGGAALTSTGGKKLTVTVPAMSFVIYKAETGGAPMVAAAAAAVPNVSMVSPASGATVELGYQNIDGNTVPDRMKIEAQLDQSNVYAEVTFAVRESGTPTYTVIGVDDNPPYRIYYEASKWPDGSKLDFVAVVNDLSGGYKAAMATDVEPTYNAGGGGQAKYEYAIVHYQRSAGDYGDHTSDDFNDFWGLHLWGDAIDPSEGTTWDAPKPFLGEDSYGRFAWIKLQSPGVVNFIVHKGNTKDGGDADRSFDVAQDGPEIWLKQGDANFYTSQAAAQGYVTIHYQRPDATYTGWGLHLWGDAIADGVGTDWGAPRPFDGIDSFGAHWKVPIKDATKPVNFIIHKGDEKDPGPDQNLMPEITPEVWVKSGNQTIYPQMCAANNMAVLHYHRPAGDYGTYTSTNYVDFWGMHTWGDAGGREWTEPLKPAREDVFGQVFEAPFTVPNPTQLNYILHRGDTKDPGPDQFLELAKWGCEAWQLEGADPEFPYVLPILKGTVAAGDLNKYEAHWVSANTIAWDVEFDPALEYRLYYAPEGGIELVDNVVTGGDYLVLTYEPQGLNTAQKAKFPHLASFAAFKLSSGDLAMVPEILKGQIAIAAVVPNDPTILFAAAAAGEFTADATGLQIPGVLDDLYTYTGDLGVTYNGDAPTLSLWAPTAKSVKLHIFDTSTSTPTTQILPMTAGPLGVWSAIGDASWTGKFYLYEVEVYVHSTGQVEHNIVTDPYSISLATNSKRSQIIDLNDAALKPAGWDAMSKPPLAAPEDIALYELHVRDFSIYDQSVPEAERGTFKAFTHPSATGMLHLKALADAGLTHIHLLPAFDFATVNEVKAERTEPNIPPNPAPDSEDPQAAVNAVSDQDGFNWGYDPYHYTTPEGSYSTNPDGVTRIVEFREMVKALHEAGLRVVMDVVYNHTTASGQAAKSVLDKVVPGYYHRLNLEGVVEKSTCCDNTASEHAMMEKLMVDSLTTWATAYGVDGFRFDLMGHHMKSNMQQVQAALSAIDPTIYVYGEGWDFGEVAQNARGVNATQINLAGTGIGTFSDRLRDAVRGGGPFDEGQSMVTNQGFVSGLFYDPNANNSGSPAEKNELLLSADQIRVGLAGNLADYQLIDRNGNLVTGAQIDYNGAPAGYTQDPQEHIIYVGAHDNQTVWDISAYKHAASVSMADRVRAQNLALDFAILAQGVPFIHAGDELLRSKSFDRDSYNSGDWFNRLDLSYQTSNWGVGLPPSGKNQSAWPIMKPLLANPALKPAPADINRSFQHMVGMLQIRQSTPLLRLQSEADVMGRLAFHNTGPNQIPGLIAMTISDDVAGLPDLDIPRERVAVIFNASDVAQTLIVSGFVGIDLTLHPVQASSSDPIVKQSSFDPATGAFSVPARTTAVFVELEKVTITVVKDSAPKSGLNFYFKSTPVSAVDVAVPPALGDFWLDDPAADDADSVRKSITFTVTRGSVYKFSESLPANWYLGDIVCSPAMTATTDLNAASVVVDTSAGDVTCTYSNQQGVNFETRVYYDRNGDGQRQSRENFLGLWNVQVKSLASGAMFTQQTNGIGKANFNFLRPGAYEVCVVLYSGWVNSQPAGPSPCYTLTGAPGAAFTPYFGVVTSSTPSTAAVDDPNASVAVRVAADPNPGSGDYFDLATWIDVDLLTPEGPSDPTGGLGETPESSDATPRVFLPVIIR